MKNNMYVLIVLLLLVLLTVGCSSRRGPFIELGVGMATIVTDEEWTVRRHDNGQSGVGHHDTIAATIFPAGNLKIGWGFTEQFLVSISGNISRLSTLGYGITVFHKKTAPSLFFDVVLGLLSLYPSYNMPDAFSDPGSGNGVSVGVGYEFNRNWTIKGDFSFGIHNIEDSTYDLGNFLGDLFGGTTGPYSTIEGKTTGYSLGFTINYIWY